MGLACTSACLALRSPGRLAICLLLGIQGALSRVLRGARPSDVYLCFASAHQFVMGPCHTPSWLLLLLPVYCSCSCVCYLSAIQEPSSRACRACRGAWTDGDASRGAEDDLPQQDPPQQQDPGQAGPSNGKGRGKRATNFSEEVGERGWGGAGVAPTSQPPARRSTASCWRAPRLPHARAHTHAHTHTHTHASTHTHARTYTYIYRCSLCFHPPSAGCILLEAPKLAQTSARPLSLPLAHRSATSYWRGPRLSLWMKHTRCATPLPTFATPSIGSAPTAALP